MIAKPGVRHSRASGESEKTVVGAMSVPSGQNRSCNGRFHAFHARVMDNLGTYPRFSQFVLFLMIGESVLIRTEE